MRDYPSWGRKRSDRLIRRRPDSREKRSLKLMATLIVLILLALFFVQQRVEYIRTERHVRKLLLEKRKIESAILPLKLEERYHTHLSRIEKVASQELNLQHPRDSQIVEIEVSDGKKGQM